MLIKYLLEISVVVSVLPVKNLWQPRIKEQSECIISPINQEQNTIMQLNQCYTFLQKKKYVKRSCQNLSLIMKCVRWLYWLHKGSMN